MRYPGALDAVAHAVVAHQGGDGAAVEVDDGVVAVCRLAFAVVDFGVHGGGFGRRRGAVTGQPAQ